MAWTERYVRADAAGSGDGTTDANSGANGAWTLAEAITNAAAGHRINIRAGTYANTTTSRTFATAGTATAPVWWRGFNSTIGDLDSDFTTAKPAITFSTGRFFITGANQIFSNLDISGAQTTNGQVRITVRTWMDRCRIECTAANANGSAVSSEVAAVVLLTRCWCKATSSAAVITLSGPSPFVFVGGYVLNGSHGMLGTGTGLTGPIIVVGSVFTGQTGDCVRSTHVGIYPIMINNTLYAPTSDGLEMTTAVTNGVVIGNIFANCGAWGINQSSGSNIASVYQLLNDFHSNTSGNVTGFGDMPSLSEITESSSPFTNAGSGDLSMISGASGKGVLFGLLENTSLIGYGDAGGLQRQETGGSSGEPSFAFIG